MKLLLNRLKRIFWIKFTFDVFARFGKDNGGLLAAGLSFFLVLAFVPLLLVGIWVLGFFIHSPQEAVLKIRDLLTTYVMPGSAGTEVRHLMERANIISVDPVTHITHVGDTVHHILATKGIAGVIGLVGIVWAAMQIFVNGAVAMNAAWEVTDKRGWVKMHLIALGLLVGTGVLLVLSLAATALSTWASHTKLGREVPGEAVIISIASEIGAVLVSGVMYAAIYKFLPAASVSWKSAFFAGTVAAISWEVAKKGLAIYLSHPNTSLYGELGNLIIFISIIYYSMMVLLLGAEVCVEYTKEVEGRRVARLKKDANVRPAADASASSGSPMTRAKEKSRAQRIRKTGQNEGKQARR